jgi:hypothetical protein
MEDAGEDYDGGGDTPEPEDTSSRADVEEAVISQKQDWGDPDPHRSDRGYLRGRRLRRKSRFLVPRISNFDAGIRAAPSPRRRARAEETFKARAQPFGIARFAFPNDQNMPTVRF